MKISEKRLGELVLRTENVEALTSFYCEIIGLELYASFGSGNFLKIADDFEGHPQLLAIFDKSWEFSGPQGINPEDARANSGTLHHFAFAMEQDEYDREKIRLQNLGQELQFAEHKQFGWHSIYLHDPDGNSVEFVCYDRTLLDEAANQSVRHQSNQQTADRLRTRF